MFASTLAKPKAGSAADLTTRLAHHRPAATAHRHGPAKRASLLGNTIGNLAPHDLSARQPQSRASWNFVDVPLSPADQVSQPRLRSSFAASFSAPIQAKLAIGKVDDPLEHEADRVADQVLRMSDAQPAINTAPLRMSRQCMTCEAEDKPGALHAKPTCAGKLPVMAPRAVHEALHGPSRPLDRSARAFFEPRFRHDFSLVRVHSDIQAADSARTVGARAYTVGRDIVFGAREYDPSSSRGARLLAHELTHVVQQAGATSPMRRTGALGGLSSVPQRLQRLGANPGCTAAQGQTIHGAIFNARGWLNKAIPKLETSPLSSGTLGSLRRNFGLTFGVAANAALIAQRLKVAYHELSNNPFGCATAAKDPRCANGACGDSFAGRHASTICADVTLTPGSDPVYATGCVLHESFHAAFSNFTVDQYSGWHGHASGMPTYPGTGTDPLLNADSYTTLVMELS